MKPLTNIKRITICEQSVARLYIESIRKHLSPNPVKEINELSEINSHLTGYVVIDVTRFVIDGFTAQEIIRLVSRTNAIIYCIWPMQMQPDEIPYDVMFGRIIFTEVFEHLKHDPVPTLVKLRDHMQDDGSMFLSTPDASSWGRVNKFYNHIGEMKPPDPNYRADIDEHVYQYSEGELRYVLDKAGLKPVEWQLVSTPSWGRHFNLRVKKV
jgi:hypothetical protein